MRHLFPLLLASLSLLSCNSRPEYVIDEDTMTSLLVDVHLSEGLLEVQGKQISDHDNYSQELMAAVLLRHGVTKAQYDTSLIWYSQNLKKLIRIYEQVDQELENQADNWKVLANEQSAVSISLSGDKVDVWGQDRALILDESRHLNHRIWRLPTDTCYYTGDTVQWQLHLSEMNQGQAVMASMVLLTEYSADIAEEHVAGVSTDVICRDSLIVLTASAPKEEKIKKIVLSLHVMNAVDRDTVRVAPALVDSISLIRIHRK